MQPAGQEKERKRYTARAAAAGIAVNVLLFAGKLAMGLVLKSMAVIADAFNNLSDSVSSLMSLLSVRFSEKPADQNHPFGHGRAEYLGTLLLGVLISSVGLELLKTSIDKIQNPQDLVFSLPAVCFLSLTVLIKLWLSWYNRKLGRRISSQLLLAAARDAFFDAVTTAVTLLSLFIFYRFHLKIDGYAGLAVSLIVLWSVVGVLRRVLSTLLGEQVDLEQQERLEQIVLSHREVIGCHDLLIHDYGPERKVGSIHVELPVNMTLIAAHALADEIETQVLDEMGVQLVVHVDPTDMTDPRLLRLKERVERVVRLMDEELSIHDFQLMENSAIIFDLQLPYSYDVKRGEEMVQKLKALLEEMLPRYSFRIRADQGNIHMGTEA